MSHRSYRSAHGLVQVVLLRDLFCDQCPSVGILEELHHTSFSVQCGARRDRDRLALRISVCGSRQRRHHIRGGKDCHPVGREDQFRAESVHADWALLV